MTYDADAEWQRIHDLPDSEIETMAVDDVLSACMSWDLPEEYARIVRVQDQISGSIIEKAFENAKSAKRFIQQNTADGMSVVAYNNFELEDLTPSVT
jgi:hypothetical protein